MATVRDARPAVRGEKSWNLAEVWEPAPPVGEEPLHGFLWTRESIATEEDTLQVVNYYTGRSLAD